jgi:hypothetical protein
MISFSAYYKKSILLSEGGNIFSDRHINKNEIGPTKLVVVCNKPSKTIAENISFERFFKLKNNLITEGGQAAENLTTNLIQATKNNKLHYVRANPTPEVVKEIQNLLSLLRKERYIDSREPSYYLGSSRLFAIKAGIAKPAFNEIETKEIIQKALQTKKDFGDIDLDVYLNDGITMKDIATFLSNTYPQKYAAETSGEEINTAVVVDNTNNVIQIDIISIAGKEEYFGVSQFASMADMAVGIKGAVRDLMIRAIAASTPISPVKTKFLDNAIKNTEEYKTFLSKNAGKGKFSYDIRYTLGGDGLAYKILWIVDGKEKTYSKGGVKFDQLQRFVKGEEITPIAYEDINTLATILGFKKSEDMKHVVKMAELVSTFSESRKQLIWNTLVKNLKTKLPNLATGRTQGQMSIEDAKTALNYLKPFFGNINTSELKELLGENILSEATKMVSIPHIDQMTPKEFCNLFSGGAWEVSEKYDGSNVSFGLTDEGQIFVKTKRGNVITNPSEYYQFAKSYDNDIFEGFGRLLETLQDSNVINLFKTLEKQIGFPVQIFGEMFSKAHMNVIPYAAELIGKGAVVIFGIVKLDTTKGTDITTTSEGESIKNQIIKTLNGTNGWNFYSKKPLALDINNTVKEQISKTCSAENMAIIATKKRTGNEAEAKAKAIQEFKILQSMIKKTLLSSVGNVASSLGAAEIEGAIIRNMQTGAIAKLVDLEGFGRRRAEQWAGVDALKDYRKSLYNQLKDDVLKNADIFVLEDKQVQKLTDAMETRGSRFTSLDEIFEVLYGDAAEEIEFREATEMVKDLTNSLKMYKKEIEQALLKINKADQKALQDTTTAIKAERAKIDQFIAELNKKVSSKQNPYLSVIQFVLGPKTIEELTKKFLSIAK